jgi:NitT/TauT family transport system ATP-binding protein
MAETAAPSPAPELMRLEHVSQIYGHEGHRHVAVKDINLVLREGEFVCLLGPSGCGKSTLTRLITGLQPPVEGHVLYDGKDLVGVNPHATIVFQTFALFPWLTAQANVEVALKARGVPPEERRKKALDLLDRVGLDGFESAYPRELSGGMKQKCGFARAMAVEPDLLCLDEPFSALDVLSAESLRGELLELWTTGAIPTRSILMVTHNIEEAVFLCDRIVVMDTGPGRIVAEVKVDLPHPRHHKDPAFLDLVDHVYALLAGQTQPEPIELGTGPGEPGRTRGLSAVTAAQIAGLVERLAEHPEQKADLPALAQGLQYEIDDLLPLTETLELLGFATVATGDISLTPLGETFAEGSILARKEIFATRIRRLPLVQWLLTMLGRADAHRLELLMAALSLDFPPAEAEKQLDTLIDWGRYAELLAYDDGAETISLEPGVS